MGAHDNVQKFYFLNNSKHILSFIAYCAEQQIQNYFLYVKNLFYYNAHNFDKIHFCCEKYAFTP